ncbi:MAG: hypothetical protein AAF755_00530 [Pseudomonadota bacterium]
MTFDRRVHLYLEKSLRESAAAGKHNFINLVVKVLKNAGFDVVFAPFPKQEPPPDQRSLSHMAHPPNAHGLVFRRVYFYPFWRIERVAQRWHWDVAKAEFDPRMEAPDVARFYRFWQQRLFGTSPRTARREGFIYVPLQGHLDMHRGFQSCSPFEMLDHCLAHSGGRRIVATLHPKETYTRSDMKRLDHLARQHAQLTITMGPPAQYLETCDFVVTQNSGVGFSGYFFAKPVLLFAEIDFHHIAVKADIKDLDTSFGRVLGSEPPFATYVWWFLQRQSINAGREEAEARIKDRFRRFGWI